MVADEDAGVVGVVVVVDDRGFVRGGELAAAALSMLFERPCPSSLSVFSRLPPEFALELAMLCALLRLVVLGVDAARGGMVDAQSPRSYLYLLQFRFPCRIRVRIQVQHHCSFGPFYA